MMPSIINGIIIGKLELLVILFPNPFLILMVLLPTFFVYNGVMLLSLLVIAKLVLALMVPNELLLGFVPLKVPILHVLHNHA